MALPAPVLAADHEAMHEQLRRGAVQRYPFESDPEGAPTEEAQGA